MSKSLEECRQNLINDNDDNEKDLTKTMKTKSVFDSVFRKKI